MYSGKSTCVSLLKSLQDICSSRSLLLQMGQWMARMEKHNDHEKMTPTLFHSLRINKITTEMLDYGLKKLRGSLWRKPAGLQQQGLVMHCPLSCQVKDLSCYHSVLRRSMTGFAYRPEALYSG